MISMLSRAFMRQFANTTINVQQTQDEFACPTPASLVRREDAATKHYVAK